MEKNMIYIFFKQMFNIQYIYIIFFNYYCYYLKLNIDS
jgi:hypothetical protein